MLLYFFFFFLVYSIGEGITCKISVNLRRTLRKIHQEGVGELASPVAKVSPRHRGLGHT